MFVCLDQNHWIYLSRAHWGREQVPTHRTACEQIRDAVDSDRVRLPLSFIHCIELLNAEAPARRARLAETFDLYGRGWFFAPWERILAYEVRRAVAAAFQDTDPREELDVFGRGYLFGSGTPPEQLNIEWSETDHRLFSWISQQPDALQQLLVPHNEANRTELNHEIRSLGQANATASEELRRRREPYDIETCRRAQFAQYTIENKALITRELGSVGRTLNDLMHLGLPVLERFYSNIPTLDVDCELTLYRDRQRHRRVKPNDVWDMSHLIVSVPYCDAVVPERFWGRALAETKLAKKYQTTVLDDIVALARMLTGRQ